MRRSLALVKEAVTFNRGNPAILVYALPLCEVLDACAQRKFNGMVTTELRAVQGVYGGGE